MTGINNGQPEATIGEPIRFGDIDGFELEQHPVSDRLIIRDTSSGKVAYIRAEQGGEIGGDGVLIKALKESKPMNDTGRTYDTIQEAEREASAWVFVPTGTYNESVEINTEGLTLQGCGYNTHITASGSPTVGVNNNNVTVRNISLSSQDINGIYADNSDNCVLNDITIRTAGRWGIRAQGDNATVINCEIEDAGTTTSEFSRQLDVGENGIVSNCRITKATTSINEGIVSGANAIISNNIISDNSSEGGDIRSGSPDSIIIGNRINNSSSTGIRVTANASDNIVANNRISDSVDSDISDIGTNTLLDGNLTGASN